MRNPSQLINILNNSSGSEGFEKFVDQLTFEEMTQIMMIAELIIECPELSSKKNIDFKEFLNYMQNKRKAFIEKN